MMYQARVDCVKEYCRKKYGSSNDKEARPLELEYEQYKEGRLNWCNDVVWPVLCQYWCSDEFKAKQKIGQECRLSSEDTAQNHGGSRPFTETQQVLEQKFGPEKATPLNTYAVMKSGIKSVDTTGSSGPIMSNRAQQRMDDYVAGVRRVTQEEEEHGKHGEHGEEEDHEEHGEDEDHEEFGDMEEVEQGHQPVHEQELNAKVLYDVLGTMSTHGRLAIGNGAVRAANVRAAGKGNNASASNSVSMQLMARQCEQLRRKNARLEQEKECALQTSKAAIELTLGLYRHLGKDIPEAAMQLVSAAQAIATGSSHIGSQSTNDGNAAAGHNGEDLNCMNRVALETSNQESGHHA